MSAPLNNLLSVGMPGRPDGLRRGKRRNGGNIRQPILSFAGAVAGACLTGVNELPGFYSILASPFP